MVDYARIRALEKENAKSQSTARSININPVYLSIVIMLSLFIYFVAYQNMDVAEMQHRINRKRVLLDSLILEQQNLLKNKNQILSPSRILSDSRFSLSPNVVEIEH